jgi:hypothetical protein
MPETHATRRRWTTFTLKGLAIGVAVVAIIVGVLSQRGRWYRNRLGNGGDPAYYFPTLMALSELEEHESDQAEFHVWPSQNHTYSEGAVWVRHGSTLRCVKPDGTVVGDGGIVVNGKNVEVLWNGFLSDGRPAIVLFSGDTSDEAFLMLVAAASQPVVHCFLSIAEPGVSGKAVDNQSWPTIELRTANGTIREQISMDPAQLNKAGEKWRANSSHPWQLEFAQ